MEEEDFLDDEDVDLPPCSIIQIPEKIIEQSAIDLATNEDENNIFLKILQAGAEYKAAGMTPIYLYDISTMHIKLITAETFGRKLH
jgi:hypothetical protein